jgi:dihydroorotase-like cyclic amidohydrolase
MAERFDVRLAGGQVLLPDSSLREVDVLISGEKIAELCEPDASADAAEEVSVRGLTVLPGVIVGQVHLCQDITVP